MKCNACVTDVNSCHLAGKQPTWLKSSPWPVTSVGLEPMWSAVPSDVWYWMCSSQTEVSSTAVEVTWLRFVVLLHICVHPFFSAAPSFLFYTRPLVLCTVQNYWSHCWYVTQRAFSQTLSNLPGGMFWRATLHQQATNNSAGDAEANI